ncbi:MAG: hypothetical protein WKG06_24395 [Segetibacter sp.]
MLYSRVRGSDNVALEFYFTNTNKLIGELFIRNCSPEFFTAYTEKYGWKAEGHYSNEEQIFGQHQLQFIPPFLRETPAALLQAASHTLPHVIQQKDIRGIIHTHSNWSDGRDTIEAMAQGAIQQGFEYLVISDHSQSAYLCKRFVP